ncbi:TPA: hypothetical protein ACNABL_004762 [Escherichia coli]
MYPIPMPIFIPRPINSTQSTTLENAPEVIKIALVILLIIEIAALIMSFSMFVMDFVEEIRRRKKGE